MANERALIRMHNIYKIFGRYPERYLDAVRRGCSKADLLEKHSRVLGLRDVSLEIDEGRIQVIMGLSGSGKSTLIRLINRLTDPTSGELFVGGTDIRALPVRQLREFRRTQIAMVFQKFSLLPHRTVLGNIAFGLEVRGVSKRDQVTTAQRWISRVGLEGFEARFPSQLSGGMQQRVGLARALANDTPILLMDEAFSALDPLIRDDMQTILLGLQAEFHKTIVFITHDLDEALRMGDRIAIMQDGELVQQGTSHEILLAPVNNYVESFVRQVNRGRVLKASAIAQPPPTELAPLCIAADLALVDAAREIVAAKQTHADLVDPERGRIGHIELQDLLDEVVKKQDGIDGNG